MPARAPRDPSRGEHAPCREALVRAAANASRRSIRTKPRSRAHAAPLASARRTRATPVKLGVERFSRARSTGSEQRARRRDPDASCRAARRPAHERVRGIEIGPPDVAPVDHADRQNRGLRNDLHRPRRAVRGPHEVDMEGVEARAGGERQVVGQRRRSRWPRAVRPHALPRRAWRAPAGSAARARSSRSVTRQGSSICIQRTARSASPNSRS